MITQEYNKYALEKIINSAISLLEEILNKITFSIQYVRFVRKITIFIDGVMILDGREGKWNNIIVRIEKEDDTLKSENGRKIK